MTGEPPPPRILFLDDDPERAAVFLAAYPEAIWVQTAEECVGLLKEPWDEVHLDHDLGGEVLVDSGRDDCGMAVVRWLCEILPDHLRPARFVIHTHNLNAACTMVLYLQAAGFLVEARPFGSEPIAPRRPIGSRYNRALTRFARWLAR